MANSGIIKSKAYDEGAHWSFEWTATNIGPGKTRIEWDLYRRGREENWIYSNCTLYINGKVEVDCARGKYYYNEVWVKGGSFELIHDNNGVASFSYKMVSAIHTASNSTVEGTISPDKNYPFTKCTAPTSFSVANIVAPGENINISWSGAAAGVGMTIKGYNFYYSQDGKNWNSSFINSTSTSSSASVQINTNAERGSYYQFKIQTLGSESGYDSEESEIVKTKINSLPIIKVFSNTGVAKYNNGLGQSISFSVSAEDTDKQTISLYYSTSQNGKKTKFTSPLIYTIKGEQGSIQNLYFWAYDGLEYSNVETSSVTINTLPIANLDVTEDGYGEYNSRVLAKTIKAACRVSDIDTIKSYKWYYKTNQSEFEFSGQNSETLNISMLNYIAPGNSYNIGVSVMDSWDEWGNIAWCEGEYPFFMPHNPEPVINISYTNGDGANIENTNFNYLGNNIWLNWELPAQKTTSNGYLELSDIRIFSDSNSVLFNIMDGNNYVFDVSKHDFGVNFTIKIATIDISGAETISIIGENFIREVAPIFAPGSIIEAMTDRYELYSNEPSDLIIRFTAPILNNSFSEKEIKFNIVADADYNGFSYPLSKNFTPILESSNLMEISISNQDLKEELHRLLANPLNENINITFTIRAENNFGAYTNNSFISLTTIVYTIEAPYFDSEASCNIGINFSGDKDTVIYSITDLTEGRKNNNLVNIGDKIYFTFTAAKDVNNDISNYEIAICRADTPDFIPSDVDYIILDQEGTKEGKINGDIVSLYREVPLYLINKFLKFRIRAVDSKGNYSSWLYPSDDQFVVAARVATPSIKLSSIDTYLDEQENNKLKGSWLIEDLGGSLFENPNYKYADYPNFERLGYPENYTNRSLSVTLECSLDENFPADERQTIVIDNIAYPIDNNYNFSFYESTQLFENLGNLNDSNFRGKNLYARLKLSINTGIYIGQNSNYPFLIERDGWGFLEVYSDVVLCYGMTPTLSHRFHTIGVNTNSFNEDVVFKVSDYNDKKYIHFTGIETIKDENGDFSYIEKNILINLQTAEVTGLIIDGGSW